MHLEVVRFKFVLSVEMFLTILTGIPGMDLTVVLFPLHLILKGRAAFFTAISVSLILCHTIFSFQRFRLGRRKSTESLGALFNERLEAMLPIRPARAVAPFHLWQIR
jgi:hypothetical protein